MSWVLAVAVMLLSGCGLVTPFPVAERLCDLDGDVVPRRCDR